MAGAALVGVAAIALSPRAQRAYRHWDASVSTHPASDAEQAGILRAAFEPGSGLAERVIGGSGHARWLLVGEPVALEACESTGSITRCVHIGDGRQDVRAYPGRLRAGLVQASAVASGNPAPRLPRVTLVSRSMIDASFASDRDVDSKWHDFRGDNPGVAGFLAASRAAVANDPTEALVYVEYHCGGECGAGYLVRVAAVDGAWKLRESVMLWIS